MKPEFVDNRNGNTLVAALRRHLDWLGRTYARPVELAIATGHFDPEGFALIADRLEGLPKVRLLLGGRAGPAPGPSRPQAGRASPWMPSGRPGGPNPMPSALPNPLPNHADSIGLRRTPADGARGRATSRKALQDAAKPRLSRVRRTQRP